MIKFENVTKKFDGFAALDDLSLEIPKGSAYGLLGSNGAGKSTMLRLLTGVYKADSGVVSIEGTPVYDNARVKQRLIFISDETAQFSNMTLNNMKKFYKTFYPRFSDEIFSRLHGMLNLPLNKKTSSFSKGMKRQAAVICAIAARPEYLFLDEAFDGLDPSMRIAVKKMMIEAMADSEMTIVISSHNLKEVEEFCDTVGMLHHGKIIFTRDLSELKGNIHKIQASFDKELTKEAFPELDVLYIEHNMGLTYIIARGDAEKDLSAVKAKAPSFCDLLPLSLEEIFIYEMEALGYDKNQLDS
ncbi:MAG: ABC transporter ATP-binding protein [Oscillospiraceae bacterium]|nr:ABC transporter ATP-binding protein [Oscillospiraceae bacterium]